MLSLSESELELLLTVTLLMVIPEALQLETKPRGHQRHVGRNSDGAQTLTVHGRLSAGGGSIRVAGVGETVNALLQLLGVIVRAETLGSSATVQIADGARAGAFALHHTHGQPLVIGRIFWGLIHLVRDDIRVNNLGPSNQRGGNGMERRTLFEMAGRDCGQRSIRDILETTGSKKRHACRDESDDNEKEGAHNRYNSLW